MNNNELEQILRGAPVPEPSPEYWEQFPGQVMREIDRRQAAAQLSSSALSPASQSATARMDARAPRSNPSAGRETWATPGRRAWSALVLSRPAFAIGVAAACLLLGFFLGIRTAWHTAGDPQLAMARKCFSEVAELFPNQVQALVLDSAGAHLVLAERPDVPSSPPLYVKITGPKGSQRFVTFSGQRIRVNGDTFEVLVDRQGDVLVVGKQSVWSSSDPGVKAGPYRIEARPLPTNS